MTARRRLCLILAAVAAGASTVRAQGIPSLPGFPTPVRLTGDMVVGSDLYTASGILPRRPGSAWHASLTPQLTLLGEFTVGFDILLSSEGSAVRQSMSQFGLNPHYKWATLHLGDFSQSYSSYTVQGTRVSGVGLDLRPGIFRFSFQTGRLQRSVSAGAGDLGYTRHLFAASIGIGREQSSYVDLIFMRAKDDTASLTAAQHDTLLLDTIPVALRPRYDVRPQENAVVGTQGQVTLFSRRLTLKGEAAAAVITRDLTSPAANPSSVSGGGTAGGLVPLTLSTSGDYAGKLDASLALGAVSLRGGYEYVGPGYTSLGLAYVINDRRSYTLGGSVRLLENRVTVQGQLQHSNDNLLRQKATTTNRDALMASAAVLFSSSLTASLSVMSSAIGNDAAVDTFFVENRSFAFTANTAIQHHLLGRQATLSLSYALQTASDANVVTRVPDVTVHNASAAYQVTLAPGLSVAPSLSYATTSSAGASAQHNVLLGVRAQSRFGHARASFNASQTYSNGRGVFAVTGQLGVPVPLGGRLTVQLRHNRYAAIGSRPAFTESFASMSVARGF
jgi:hypothetical protein